ncbi:MAG: GNAT family N-acetyltransferase [Candidatus Symbiobacter sp.]|nr:GNAT family N-acetyltransferase [Candidatus Symbiobacter sp.]
MTIIYCNFKQHGVEVQAIFNQAIISSTAIYEEAPWSLDVIEQWFATRVNHGFPVVGWLHKDRKLTGFASYAPFDQKSGYRYSATHSVYVSPEFQGQGIGRKLMLELVSCARSQPLQSIIGLIESQNQPSINLHESLGFERAGILKNVGLKFGLWRHTIYYQLQLGHGELANYGKMSP